jgi:hypothetical protein
MAHHHHVEDANVLKSELILAQATKALVLVAYHGTRTGLQFATEDFHEGRFAATVGADEPIAIAVAEFDRYVFEQRLRAELHGDVGGGEHENEAFFWTG